ncbi:MAG: DUF5024 domain-containing protein [Muribaculaceae bacterium]|nr:DUF5024 domain-containing protein [Muribaculaceae bacterium]
MARTIISAIALLCIAISASAQAKIDKYIEDMEKRPDVETTYTERRAPRKKKLVRISRIMNFQNPKYYQQLIKAFEDERDNTVSASKTDKMMTYRFENNKGTSTYSLTWGQGYSAPYTLVMSWRSQDADDQSYIGDEHSTGSEILVFDSFGCNTKVSTSTSTNNYQKQADKAREQAAIARKQASEARKQASEARKQALKANRKAAEAKRRAARAHGYRADCKYSERAYQNALRASCRTISPAGQVCEFSAFDAMDNNSIWEHLEKTDVNANCTVTITEVSGATTIIDMKSPLI